MKGERDGEEEKGRKGGREKEGEREEGRRRKEREVWERDQERAGAFSPSTCILVSVPLLGSVGGRARKGSLLCLSSQLDLHSR